MKHPIVWLTSLLTGSLLATGLQAGELVIIIDDVGNNGPLGELAVSLPAPVNLAFLPETPYAARLARKAKTKGHTVMLHAPMATESGFPLGPDGLYADMDEASFKHTLQQSLDSIPGVQGFNNHMGSLLTQDCTRMGWAMEVARQRHLFFIDSRTTANTCAARSATAAGVANLSRDVFLDNDRSAAALEIQFQKAVTIAATHGRAILIGHPYPETMAYLHQKLGGDSETASLAAAAAADSSLPLSGNHEYAGGEPVPTAASDLATSESSTDITANSQWQLTALDQLLSTPVLPVGQQLADATNQAETAEKPELTPEAISAAATVTSEPTSVLDIARNSLVLANAVIHQDALWKQAEASAVTDGRVASNTQLVTNIGIEPQSVHWPNRVLNVRLPNGSRSLVNIRLLP
ncbi:divergent polysaccharide deacetylase family protein [Oceanobacter mangrovi]|uniref:divergent polysaccharide deacetylase family protein n=1 Tax=Oceanobacter mangrovi TaxID=2862510 RepID=UPI001C8E8400|nr:divergent polysaccharide deacetylase family protein [Oceanobacter mangrovi]